MQSLMQASGVTICRSGATSPSAGDRSPLRKLLNCGQFGVGWAGTPPSASTLVMCYVWSQRGPYEPEFTGSSRARPGSRQNRDRIGPASRDLVPAHVPAHRLVRGATSTAPEPAVVDFGLCLGAFRTWPSDQVERRHATAVGHTRSAPPMSSESSRSSNTLRRRCRRRRHDTVDRTLTDGGHDDAQDSRGGALVRRQPPRNRRLVSAAVRREQGHLEGLRCRRRRARAGRRGRGPPPRPNWGPRLAAR